MTERYGPAFDCLVNNAGTDTGAGLVDITDEQWHRVIAVNQTGPLFTSREFIRRVLLREPAEFPADIVNVISISAITVGTDAAAYNASKAALAKITQVIQREASRISLAGPHPRSDAQCHEHADDGAVEPAR